MPVLTRKRAAVPAQPDDEDSSGATNVDNTAAVYNETSIGKRKKVSTQSRNAVINNKIQHDFGKDISDNRRQCEYDSEEPTKTNDDHTPFEESPATIILGLDYYILCKLAKEKLSWVVGNGQRHILPVQLELTRYYSGEGSGVDTLKADIAAIDHNYGFSSDSDDDSDDEVEEINKESSVAAVEDAAEEDDEDFNFDNDGDDESIDGTTDPSG